MSEPFWLSGEPKPDLLAARLAELREALCSRNPGQLAADTGAHYSEHDQVSPGFRFQLWDREVRMNFPELIAYEEDSGQELPASSQALLLYYFFTCDGAAPSAQWISFSELPDGCFYNQAFQGYTGGKLARAFQSDFDLFCQAAENLGGKRVYLLGDAAYEYNVLPLVNLLVVTWRGDEEFSATYQILFDAAVSHHIPTDACAIIGSILSGRLVKELEKIS